MRNYVWGLCMAAAIGSAGWAGDGPKNLLPNGDFAKGKDGWRIVTEKGNTVEFEDGECRFTIQATKKGTDAQIGRKITVTEGAKYRFSGEMRASRKQLTYFQLKMLNGKTQVKSLAIKDSETEWKAFTLEFLAEASGLEVIARFKQNPGFEGSSGAFRNLAVVEVAAVDTAFLERRAAEQAAADDAAVAGLPLEGWLAPEGAGDRSGRSRENAADTLAAAWRGVGPGGVVHVLPGVYRDQSLTMTSASGGRVDRVKRLVGVSDADGHPPRFIGDWQKNVPATGRDFIKMELGVAHVSVENLAVEHYRDAFHGFGRHTGLTFRDLLMRDIRSGIVLNNTDGALIERCAMEGFTKRGVRLQANTSNIVVRDCLADAGGEEYATEPFHMGFSAGGVKGTVDRDIRYERCLAKNAYHNAGDKYWNADGFCAESNTANITWIDCAAYDCTDGGWDIKTKNGRLVNCVALRNKRNFRIWSSEESVLENCLAGYAIKRGGSGTAAGLHVCGGAGKLRAVNCSVVNNAIAVDADQKGVATLESCLIVMPNAAERAFSTEADAAINGRETCTLLNEHPAFPADAPESKDGVVVSPRFNRPADVPTGFQHPADVQPPAWPTWPAAW